MTQLGKKRHSRPSWPNYSTGAIKTSSIGEGGIKSISQGAKIAEGEAIATINSKFHRFRCRRSLAGKACLFIISVTLFRANFLLPMPLLKTDLRMSTNRTAALPALNFTVPENVIPPHYFAQLFVNSKKGISFSTVPDFLPFMIQHGRLFCPKHFRFKLKFARNTLNRGRYVARLIQEGLRGCTKSITKLSNNQQAFCQTLDQESFPFLLQLEDGNGCNAIRREDSRNFPRLTWSFPSKKFGNASDWCPLAFAIPTYQQWYDFQGIKSSSYWDHDFRNDDLAYPWRKKKGSAVWRGSTTHCSLIYRNVPFSDIPRVKLVQLSMSQPELIDAAFTRIVDGFVDDIDGRRNQTCYQKPIPKKHMMLSKAIIDIDGNNWSSRFASLLCMNSVVIKIEPDYIEYFYQDLIPMKHYIPATLDNLTDVIKYVIDDRNEEEMLSIVEASRNCCRSAMTKKAIAEDMVERLAIYSKYLQRLNLTWTDDQWERMRNDMIECNLWSVF